MIWHIFKKDVKLSWRLGAAVALLHWASIMAAFMMLTATSGPAALKARNLAGMLIIGGLIAKGFIITAVVHNDAIPGVRQDWLVRPLRRRDLMLAKVLFVLVMVQLPVFLGDVTALVTIRGVSVSSALIAALERFAIQMLVINLPFLAVAAITRNFLEVVSVAVVLGLSGATVIGLTPNTSPIVPLSRTGLYWIVMLAASIVLVVGGVAVMCLQYFQRRTILARIFTGATTTLFLFTPFIPWQPAFAVQRALANDPGANRNLNVSFDPAAGRFRPPAGSLSPDMVVAVLRGQADEMARAYLPLRVTGLPADSFVKADHSKVRVIEPNGQVDQLDLNLDYWNGPSQGGIDSGAPTYPSVEIPGGLYKRIKDQKVRIDIDLWLTLLRSISSNKIPAVDGKQDIAGAGRCRTRINDAETAVTVSCLQAGSVPDCFGYFLENTPTGDRNPRRFSCQYYVNLPAAILPISLNTIGGSMPFRDGAGLAKYPVDGSKLRDAQVVVQIYQPQDHFMRTLSIPEIRLAEWAPESAPAEESSSMLQRK
jgi:hypothetical protein